MIDLLSVIFILTNDYMADWNDETKLKYIWLSILPLLAVMLFIVLLVGLVHLIQVHRKIKAGLMLPRQSKLFGLLQRLGLYKQRKS
ncbi:hypothetical protein RJG79_01665 [Mycoplasmatota bacterium WC44]